VDELALLEIASRPARRPDDVDYLASLRAIPWVFAWTQNRVLLPAWFGYGTAFDSLSPEELHSLYEELPFFRTVVDNLEMTLAKSSLEVARGYLELVPDVQLRDAMFASIEREHELAVVGRSPRVGRRAAARTPADRAANDRPTKPVRGSDERDPGRVATPPPRRRRGGAPTAAPFDRRHRSGAADTG